MYKILLKNQEFINIVTHQLLQSGKSDEDIQTIFAKTYLEIIENKSKESPLTFFLVHQLLGQLNLLKQNKTSQQLLP